MKLKVNWKQFSKSPGYKSLKAAYCKDVRKASMSKHPMRDKEELLKHFNWIIGLAKHHAHHKHTFLDIILNEWERDRKNNWWFGHYQKDRQLFIKLYEHPRKAFPTTFRGLIRRARLGYHGFDSKNRKSSMARVKRAISCYCQDQKEKNGRRVGAKRRWSKATKEHHARVKAHEQQRSL